MGICKYFTSMHNIIVNNNSEFNIKFIKFVDNGHGISGRKQNVSSKNALGILYESVLETLLLEKIC